MRRVSLCYSIVAAHGATVGIVNDTGLGQALASEFAARQIKILSSVLHFGGSRKNVVGETVGKTRPADVRRAILLFGHCGADSQSPIDAGPIGAGIGNRSYWRMR